MLEGPCSCSFLGWPLGGKGASSLLLKAHPSRLGPIRLISSLGRKTCFGPHWVFSCAVELAAIVVSTAEDYWSLIG